MLDRQAYTDAPYKNTLSRAELPTTAAAPIINIPVPKKNDRTIEIQNFFLKIILINLAKTESSH